MGLNFRAIIKILGILTLIEGLFMLPAVAAGLSIMKSGRPQARFYYL